MNIHLIIYSYFISVGSVYFQTEVNRDIEFYFWIFLKIKTRFSLNCFGQ